MIYFFESILYSYAQIFFSNRLWFGAAALVATMVIPEMGLLGLCGVIISNSAALYLKFDKNKIHDGFYGFNGILIGAAVSFYFELTTFVVVMLIIFILLTFFISAVLENYMAAAFNLPGLSLPFIISLYIFFIFLTNFDTIIYKGLSFQHTLLLDQFPEYVILYLKSISLILFQSSIFSGIILAFTILLFSRVMFVNSIIAFIINYFIVHLIFPNPNDSIIILTSFNSILAAFALGGGLIILSRKSILVITLASIFIIVFTGFFTKLLSGYMLPVLVLPFNFVVLATLYSLKFRQEHSDLVLLYFKPGSPEENYYYHGNRRSRFQKFKNLFPELPFFGEWFISQGIEGNITHKEHWKYAWDFNIKNSSGEESKNDGLTPEDFLCYDTPVAAPLDAKVVNTLKNVEDNEIGEVNLKQNWGNTIVLDHGEGLFSSLSHLKRDSIKVKTGDEVKKGEIIAKCGNSGRSPIPHLHFQFQLTDKIGDKTFKFPIAHFLEKINGEYSLKTFDFPESDSYVRNIETHDTLKNAFDFKLGDEFVLKCSLNDKSFSENWIVKVDISNNVYIESDNNATAYLYLKEKVFYISNFIGNKKSALYFFYLNAIRVPLGFIEDLVWEDEFPVGLTTNNIIRYLSEFFLLTGRQLKSIARFSFKPVNPDEKIFRVETALSNSGIGLFSFYKENGRGDLTIDKEGVIKSFVFLKRNIKFFGEIITDPEE
ncbi:urea transporter [Bacteroidota bacterium]